MYFLIRKERRGQYTEVARTETLQAACEKCIEDTIQYSESESAIQNNIYVNLYIDMPIWVSMIQDKTSVASAMCKHVKSVAGKNYALKENEVGEGFPVDIALARIGTIVQSKWIIVKLPDNMDKDGAVAAIELMRILDFQYSMPNPISTEHFDALQYKINKALMECDTGAFDMALDVVEMFLMAGDLEGGLKAIIKTKINNVKKWFHDYMSKIQKNKQSKEEGTSDLVIRGLSLPPAGYIGIIINCDGSWETIEESSFSGQVVRLPRNHGDLIDKKALKESNTDIVGYVAEKSETGNSLRQIHGYSEEKVEQQEVVLKA